MLTLSRWELIEIFRKLTFVVIAAWGRDLEPINQSSMATVAVLVVLLLELYFHPFRSALFDLLEEFTTLTEVRGLGRGARCFCC